MLSFLIGRPERKDDVMDYVLEDFTRNERNQLSAMKETMIDTVHQIVAVMLSPPGMQPFSYWLYNFLFTIWKFKVFGGVIAVHQSPLVNCFFESSQFSPSCSKWTINFPSMIINGFCRFLS